MRVHRARLHVAAFIGQHSPARELGWVVTALTWLLLVLLLSSTGADPDLWGHIRFGLDVQVAGKLPTVDPYSFTQDRPIVYHEWLGALLLSLAYRAGGVTALLLLKLAVVMGVFWILWRAWRPVHPLIASAVLLFGAWAAQPTTSTMRPQLWTLLGLLLLLQIVQRPPSVRVAAYLALLFAVWVNLHGGFIVGLGVLGLWSAASAWRQRSEARLSSWQWLALPVVALLATLLNPYGIGIWQFLGDTVRPSRDVTEWQPLWTATAFYSLPVMLFGIGIIAGRLWPSLPSAAVLLLLAVAGLQVVRIAPLGVCAAILLIAPVAARRWPAASWRVRAPSRVAGLIMLVPVITAAVLIAPLTAAPFHCLSVGDHQDPDGLARLQGTTLGGRVAVWFDWGQYAIWHLSPRFKVSWDGRRETLYSSAMHETQKAVAFGQPAGDAWLRQVKPEYVWLPARYSVRRSWLVANGYRIDHSSATSFIAVRKDVPVLPLAAPGSRCAF